MVTHRNFLLPFSLVLVLIASAQGSFAEPYIGHVRNEGSGPEYHMTFNFGIEQWDNGVRSEDMNEKWLLNCHLPGFFSKGRTTYCRLERMRFWLLDDEVITRSLKYESIEGTLKIINADWERGALDLSLVETNKTTTEVKIRMTYTEMGSISLSSFQAFTIARGVLSDTLEPIEFKIPSYTYTLNVPVKMRGLRTEDDKKMDELYSSLSQRDQKAWDDFKAEGAKKCDIFSERKTHTEEQMLEKLIPDWDKRKVDIEKGGKLTEREQNLIKEYVSSQWAECLSRSMVSLEGQKKLLEMMLAK